MSLERKTKSSKTHSPDVASQPTDNSTLVVVTPPTTSSTPSSPYRDGSLRRNRSHSSDAGLPMIAVDKTRDGDDDVYNGNESVGFSLAELARYCNTDHQQTCHEDNNEENQLTDGEHTCKSRDHDDVVTTTTTTAETRGTESSAETSSLPNKVPLQVCGVKPPVVEQPAQTGGSVDESPQPPSESTVASTKSDNSSNSQQPSHRVNSAGTRTKTKSMFPDKQTQRSSEAITDITQAKKLTHRAVVTRKQKTSDLASDCKVAQRQKHQQQPIVVATTTSNGTRVDELPKRCSSPKSVSVAKSQSLTGRVNSGRGSREKLRSKLSLEEEQIRRLSEATTENKKQEHHVTVARSEKIPAIKSDSKEASTRQDTHKTVTDPSSPSQDESQPPQPEIKVAVQSKPAAGSVQPPSNVNRKSTSTTAQKSVPKRYQPPPPPPPPADDDDSDDDWQNLITAFRDPDDIRTRKAEQRRGSSWNLWGKKPAIEEKTEDDSDEKEDEVNDAYNNFTHQHIINGYF